MCFSPHFTNKLSHDEISEALDQHEHCFTDASKTAFEPEIEQ